MTGSVAAKVTELGPERKLTGSEAHTPDLRAAPSPSQQRRSSSEAGEVATGDWEATLSLQGALEAETFSVALQGPEAGQGPCPRSPSLPHLSSGCGTRLCGDPDARFSGWG